MEDYRLTQSGQEVQDILNGAAMQVDLTAETERATEAEQTLQGNIDAEETRAQGAEGTLQDNIDAEETRAQGAEGTLQDNIDAEETRAKAAEKQNADDIDAIEEKIPSGASSSNKLTTEEYVNDSVATATATFRGTYNVVTDLSLLPSATHSQISASLKTEIATADNNDFAFVLIPTSVETPEEIEKIERYKYNGSVWGFEYVLNNSGFTAAQWSAINSGITSNAVGKLDALPNNAELTTLLNGKQNTLTFDNVPTQGSSNPVKSGGVYSAIKSEETRAMAAESQNANGINALNALVPAGATSENKLATIGDVDEVSSAIEAILLLIPSAASALNQLADKAFVNSSIATATATFRGTYNLVNDLGLTTSATYAQISTALASAILTADNNDYAFVQIPTSDAMPTEIAKTERYKFNGTAWEYEYDLNNSGFTADQWAAINSGITQALVTKLSALPTNAELTTELGTLTSGITTINQKIPNAASQANKLVDTAAMESYIVQVLDVLTISYNISSTDGHVTVHIEQVDGKITSVTLTTSDIASAAALNLKASQTDLTALASRVTTAEGNITTLGGRMTTAEGNITSLGGRVSTNETDIANLQQLYNDLQQSKPVPVTALPSTGQQQGVIYRLAGTTSYSDYMWNGSTWVLMATYNNAIDDEPTAASNNLVKSGGIAYDLANIIKPLSINLFNKSKLTVGYIVDGGAIAANANYKTSDFIRVTPGAGYRCSNNTNYMVCLYDEFGAFVKYYVRSNDFNNTATDQIPSGAAYARFTMRNEDVDYAFFVNANDYWDRNTWDNEDVLTYSNGVVADELKGKPKEMVKGVSTLQLLIQTINSIRNTTDYHYTIYLAEGTYNLTYETIMDLPDVGYGKIGLLLPDNVDLIGLGKGARIVTDLTGKSAAYQPYISPLNIKFNNKLKNLTIEITNGRYAVHADNSNNVQNIKWEIEDCTFIHHGCSDGNWNYPYAWGEGGCSGHHAIFRNCKFIAQNGAYYVHNNVGFTRPMYHRFDDCEFISTSKACAVMLQSLNSGTKDVVEFNGCTFNGILDSRKGSAAAADFNSCDFVVIGSGNSPLCENWYYTDGVSYHSCFGDEVIPFINNTESAITAGLFMKWDSDELIPMTDEDDTITFVGVCLDNVPIGGKGYVKVKGSIRVAQPSSVVWATLGTKLKVASNTEFAVADNINIVGKMYYRNTAFTRYYMLLE